MFICFQSRYTNKEVDYIRERIKSILLAPGHGSGGPIPSISSLLETRAGEVVTETCSPTADLKRLYLEAGRCGVLIYFFPEDEMTRESG